jgi:hypothetical protein
MTWKLRYQEAHRQNFSKVYPLAYNDGLYSGPKYPVVSKANGLTSMIVNFLLWSCHHGERTNTMGTPIKKFRPKFNIFTGQTEMLNNGVEWRKGNGTKGSSDIKGHINNVNHKFPIPIYVEVKIGADRMSEYQKEYEKQVSKTGALYCVVKTPDDWFSFYDYVINL